ncbi:hypothetical protein [Arsukibacterium sp.]|uniref:hypothetical protein n=1 Tax=Arsukibacterium sp. TaxID=1977258 RepID=UPI00299EAA1A|nr:hypothetical protein [Arsukibacterium sp.]MDX1536377.1 hypothetical protein [Arsukibacterium sp.]
MKLGRCPVCHSNLHLDQLIADEAGRQLLGQFARMNYKLGGNMVAYLALFRPTKQDLSNAKALGLVTETLALTNNHNALAEALEQTVASLQQSRINGTGKQLTNHNYLRKVLTARLGQIAQETPVGSTIEYKAQTVTNPDEDRRLFQERMRQLGGRVHEVPNE